MPKLRLEIDVPEELLTDQLKPDFVAALRKQAILDLLRHAKLSQSRAAHLLGVSRAELFDLMAEVGVSQVDVRHGEIEQDAARVAEAHRPELR